MVVELRSWESTLQTLHILGFNSDSNSSIAALVIDNIAFLLLFYKINLIEIYFSKEQMDSPALSPSSSLRRPSIRKIGNS